MLTPNVVILLAALSVAIAVPLLLVAMAPGDRVRGRMVARLKPNGSGQPDLAVRGLPVLASWGRGLSPQRALRRLDSWHGSAGRPASWPLERVLATKFVLGAMGFVIALAVVAGSISTRTVTFGVGLAAFLFFLPDLLLLNTGLKRKQLTERQLPDVLDQLSIAVEAGLGFDAALNHVSRHSAGPLPEEIVRTLQDIRVGVPRRDAYLDLAQRANVADLRRFVRAIVQAEQRGISVARVLQVQAREMRLKRGQRAEETVMKIPVKVIFPLMFCIMPALFVVILGPAAMNIMDTFPR